MDYIIIMQTQQDARQAREYRHAVEKRLEEMVEGREIAGYHRFRTGHFAMQGAGESARRELQAMGGIEDIVEPPTYFSSPQDGGYGASR